MLMSKYDRNGNNAIDFDEYFDLHQGINVLHKEFVDIDFEHHLNGRLSVIELTDLFRRKGFNFTFDFCEFLIRGMSRDKREDGLTFDKYLGAMARIDTLINQYQRNSQLRQYQTLENFIRNNFFHQF
jgi:hypothetical protein